MRSGEDVEKRDCHDVVITREYKAHATTLRSVDRSLPALWERWEILRGEWINNNILLFRRGIMVGMVQQPYM